MPILVWAVAWFAFANRRNRVVDSIANIIKVRSSQQTQPSIKSGYARSASESAFPALWDKLNTAAVPGLGNTGDTLHDWSHKSQNIEFGEDAGVGQWVVRDGRLCWRLNKSAAEGDLVNYQVDIRPHRDDGKSITVFLSWHQNALNNTVGHWLINKRDATLGGDDDKNWQLVLREDTGSYYLRGAVWDTSKVATIVTDTEAMSAGEWYTGAFTAGYQTGDPMVLYKNGKEVGSDTLSGPRKSTDFVCTIGKSVSTDDGWTNAYSAKADFESVLIYDRALTPQEIALLHADPLAPFRLRKTAVTTIYEAPATTSVANIHVRKPHVPTNEIDFTHPLNQGLVRYYLGTRDVRDDLTCHVTGIAATRQGGLSSYKNGPAGVQNAAEFTAASEQRYQVADAADLSFGNASTDSPFTISGWVYLTTNTVGVQTPVVSKSSTSSAVEYILFANSSATNQPRFSLYDSSGSNQIRVYGGDQLETYRWYHICGTYDGSGSENGLNLYRDGINISDTREENNTYVAMHNTTATFDIGAIYRSDATFEDYTDGQLCEIRLYDRELSAGEVQGLYDLTRSGRNFKRQTFSFASESNEAPAVEPTGNIIKVRSNTQPSIKSGYARSASESAFPGLWDGMTNAWLPMLGPANINLHDYVGNVDFTESYVISVPEWIVDEGGWGRYQNTFADTGNSTTYKDIGTGDRSWTFYCDWGEALSLPDLMSDRILGGAGTVPGFIIGHAGNASVSDDACSFFIDDGAGNWKTRWYQVGTGKFAMTFTWHNASGTIALYVYGREKSSNYEVNDNGSGTVAGKSIGSSGELVLGGRPNTTDRDYAGTVQTCIIHDRVLSPQEIQLLHADPLAPFRLRKTAVTTIDEAPPPTTTSVANIHVRKSHVPTNEVNWNDPLNKGLVAWWPFRQKGGNVLRDVVGENHGTLESSMTSSDWVASPETKSMALDFDGTDDFVGCGSADEIFPTGSYRTVSAWFSFTINDANNRRVFTVSNDSDSTRFTLAVESGKVAIGYRDDPGDALTYDTSTLAYNTGDWIHAVAVFDNSDWRLLINGIKDISGAGEVHSATYDLGSGYKTNIGNYAGGLGNVDFDGSISDVRLYDRALSDSEVLELYRASRQGYPTQFKRQTFSFASESNEAPAVEPTGNIIKVRSPQQTQPSIKSGYARSASESAFPGLWAGLVGAWVPMLGPTGGTLYDITKRNDGTLTNMEPASDWVIGEKGWALDFDGSDDYVRIPNSDILEPQQLTVTAIAKSNLATWDDNGILVSKRGQDTEQGYILHPQGAAKEVRFFLRGNDAAYYYASATPDDIEEWHAYSGSCDSSNIRFYLDGRLTDTTAFTPGVISYSGADVGLAVDKLDFTAGERWGNVQIGAVLIHNRALSPQEIQLLHADPLAPFRLRKTAVTTIDEAPATTSVANIHVRKSHVPTAEIDFTHPLNQGLVRYYLGTRDVRDDLTCHVTGIAATRYNGLSSYKNGPAGVQNAAEFTAASEQHYRVADAADLSFGNASTDSPFTLSGWVYLTTNTDGVSTPIASKGSINASNGVEYMLRANHSSTNQPRFSLYDSSGGNQSRVYGGDKLETFRWYHICGTYDGSGSQNGLNLYCDGINVSDTREKVGTYVAMHNTTSTFDIGAMFRSDATFEKYVDGQLCEIRLYDRELSAGEVQGLYDLTRSGRNFKRQTFSFASESNEAPAPAVEPTGNIIKVRSNTQPSIKSGYARSASESAFPELWRGLSMAFVPALGNTGDKLQDYSPYKWDFEWQNDAGPDWWTFRRGHKIRFDRTAIFQPDNDNSILINNFHMDVDDGISFFMYHYQYEGFALAAAETILDLEDTSASGNSGFKIYTANNSSSLILGYTGGAVSFFNSVETDTWHTSGISVPAKSGLLKEAWGTEGGYGGSLYDFKRTKTATSTADYPSDTVPGKLMLGNELVEGIYNSFGFAGEVGVMLLWGRYVHGHEMQLLHADPLAPFRLRKTAVTTIDEAPPTTTSVGNIHVRKSHVPTAEIDFTHPLNHGLVRYYLGTRDIRDDLTCHVTSIAATRYNGLSSYKNGPAGVQNAAEFTAASEQHYRVADAADLSFGNASTDSPFTISGWVYLTTNTVGVDTPIVSKSESGSVVEYVLFANESDVDQPRLVLLDASYGNQITVYGGDQLETFRWHHLCGTYDGSGSENGLNLYLNGINISDTRSENGTYVAMHNTTATFDIGAMYRTNATFEAYTDGQLCEIRLYDRELSAGEVQGLYDLTRSGRNFKRQTFSFASESNEAPAVEPTGNIIKVRSPQQTQPSIKSGYARSASESTFPGLWKDLILAHVPELGFTGGVLPNFAGERFSDFQYSGTADGANSTLYRGSQCHLWNTDGEGVVINSQPAEDRNGITCMVFYSPLDLTTTGSKYLFSKSDYWAMYHPSAFEALIVEIPYFSGLLLNTFKGSDNTVSGGDWQQAAFSVTDNQANDDVVLYLNGKVTAIETMGAGNVRDVGANQVMIGQSGASSSNSKSYIKSCFQWNRVLNIAEVKLLNADPLAPFRTRRQVVFAAPTEAAAAAYQAYEIYYRRLLSNPGYSSF